MLQDIRQSSKNGWTYIMVGVLIVVFAVFFGAPLDSCGGSQGRKVVAKVGSTDIYDDDVNLIFNRYFGNRRGTDESQVIQQQATSLRALVYIHLLAERAEAAGIRVEEDEFQAYIKDRFQNIEFMYAYGQSGKFDGPFYKAYVQNQLRVSIPKYEEFKRRELLARKYLATVEMQFQPLPSEIEALHQLRNTKVDLEFAKFEKAPIQESVPVTEADVDAYLASNAADIKKHYDTNKAEYSTPEQLLVRRIFILKPAESEGPDKVAEAVEKWDKVKERVKTEDFATVAGEMTEDYAKEKQGLMDWTSIDNMDQNIAKALRGKDKGTVEEVETQFAFMMVKLEDTKPAKVTPLAEVQKDIAEQLLQEKKVDEVVLKLTNELRAKMATAKSLEEAVNQLKEENAPEGEDATNIWDAVTVSKTGLFNLEGQDLAAMFGAQIPGLGRSPWDRVPAIGKSAEIAKTAFELTKEKPMSQKVYSVGGAQYMIRLADRQDPTPEKLEEDRAKLEAEIRGQKVTASLGAWPALFAAPQDNYGPWFDVMFDEALDKKQVKFFKKNYAAVPLLIDEEEPVEDPTKPAEEKKEEGA